MHKPGYISLAANGELMRRAAYLKQRLKKCVICPHTCGIDRNIDNSGFCQSYSTPYICSYGAHHGEEPPISGYRGSGTVFLGRCNLNCVYCQNPDISQLISHPEGYSSSTEEFAQIMLDLQNSKGCHNINFVSPSHFVPQILEAIAYATSLGLEIPLVYNTNSYDRVETLKILEGIIDIYLPDLKYSDDSMAQKYSGIPDYVSVSRQAIAEMYRQVGLLKTDANGIAKRGLLIRHLVLPNNISGSEDSLEWIASKLSPLITVNLMAQYHPAHKATAYPELLNRPSGKEYMNLVNTMEKMGFQNALYQNIGI